MGVMFVQLLPYEYVSGVRFHGFWEMMENDKGSLLQRIPEVAEGLVDGSQGVTILLLLVFLHRWPERWNERSSLVECRRVEGQKRIPDPGRMHVRRLWVLLISWWVLHIVLDYTCQRDFTYALVMITCSLGFDLAANTFIWALWHEKLVFKHRLAGLQQDWLRRREQGDFKYDNYRDDYVQCMTDLEPLGIQWSRTLGLFVVVHGLEVVLRVVQLFCMIHLKFALVVNDYLLLAGLLFVYSGRLFIVLFWSVGMNNQADDLQSFIRCRLSPGDPERLNLDFLVQLVKDCPISFCVLGARPNRAEVLSLLIAVIGSIASGIVGNLLGGLS